MVISIFMNIGQPKKEQPVSRPYIPVRPDMSSPGVDMLSHHASLMDMNSRSPIKGSPRQDRTTTNPRMQLQGSSSTNATR